MAISGMDRLLADPLLGKALALLLLGEDLPQLITDLQPVLERADLESLQSSYETFRAEVTAMLYAPTPDGPAIAAADHLVTLAALVLSNRGQDPLAALGLPAEKTGS